MANPRLPQAGAERRSGVNRLARWPHPSQEAFSNITRGSNNAEYRLPPEPPRRRKRTTPPGPAKFLNAGLQAFPIRPEYLIVDGGKLASAGAHSYSVGTTA